MNEKIPIRKLLLWSMAWGVLCCNSAQGASFDCAKAGTKVEKMICSNPEVSQLDEDLLVAYKAAYKQTADPVWLKIEQRQWLKERNTCSDDAACLTKAYRSHIDDLKMILAGPKPCFRLLERQWPETPSGHYPVCVDFVASLNKQCDNIPFAQWPVDPSIKTLALPNWEEIDPKTHLKVIQNLYQLKLSIPEKQWVPIPPKRMKLINNGTSRMWHTYIDLDRDGEKEHVVRFDAGPLRKTKTRNFQKTSALLAVTDKAISKVNAQYEYLRSNTGVIIHDGLPYIVDYGQRQYHPTPPKGSRKYVGFSMYEPFDLGPGDGKGIKSVCVFEYLK